MNPHLTWRFTCGREEAHLVQWGHGEDIAKGGVGIGRAKGADEKHPEREGLINNYSCCIYVD